MTSAVVQKRVQVTYRKIPTITSTALFLSLEFCPNFCTSFDVLSRRATFITWFNFRQRSNLGSSNSAQQRFSGAWVGGHPNNQFLHFTQRRGSLINNIAILKCLNHLYSSRDIIFIAPHWTAVSVIEFGFRVLSYDEKLRLIGLPIFSTQYSQQFFFIQELMSQWRLRNTMKNTIA